MGLLDRIQKISNNPLAMAGLGLLSMPTRSRTPINPLEYAMYGMQAGLQNQHDMTRAKQMEQELAMRTRQYEMQTEQYERARQQEDQIKQYVNQSTDPNLKQIYNVGGASAAAKYLTEKMKPQAPIKLGTQLLDPVTLKPVATQEPEQTTTQKEYDQAKSEGYGGTLLEYKTLMANAKRPSVTVNNSPDQTFKNANTLRDEFITQSKEFALTRDAYSRIQSAGSDPSAAGDMALIFSFMKMLDPGSTVREGEYATAESARGVPESIRNQYNKILHGERLAPLQRHDFIKQASNIYAKQESIHQARIKTYEGLSNKFGIDPTTVTIDMSGGIKEMPAQEFEEMPSPAKLKGKTIEDDNGKRWKSNGIQWIEQ